MNFLKNIFTTIKNKGLLNPDISYNDNNSELPTNMDMRGINELTNTQILRNNSNNEVTVIFNPIDVVNFEDKVSENYKKPYENIPEYEIFNDTNIAKVEKLSLKRDSNFEGDINTIHMETLKETSDINSELCKKSVVPEFNEILSNLREADTKNNFKDESFSMGFIDDFFGKLNADNNNNSILNDTHENIHDNKDSTFLLKLEKPALLGNADQVFDNKIINDEPHTIINVNIDDSIELNKIDEKNGITGNKCVETREFDSKLKESDNRDSVINNDDVYKENTEHIENTHTEFTVGNDYSFKGLQTKTNCNKNHIDNFEKEIHKIESTRTKCKKLCDANQNFNDNSNPKIIYITSSDDEIDSTYRKKRFTKAKLDTISISSTEDDVLNINKMNDPYSDGYHSSDFEFITENEAKLDGLILKTELPKQSQIFKTKNKDEFFTQKCGPSGTARTVDNYHSSPSTSNIRNKHINTRCEARRNEIPQGDGYLNLFRGIYDPVLPFSEIYFLENKSVQITTMNMEFEGIGFDMRIMPRRKSESTDDESKQEAIKTRRKIISTYSRVNRKRHYHLRNKQK